MCRKWFSSEFTRDSAIKLKPTGWLCIVTILIHKSRKTLAIKWPNIYNDNLASQITRDFSFLPIQYERLRICRQSRCKLETKIKRLQWNLGENFDPLRIFWQQKGHNMNIYNKRLYGSIFCLLINSKYSPNWFLCWKLYNVMHHTEFRHNSWKHYNHEYFNALMVFYTWFMKYEIDILIKNLIYWSWWHFVLLRLHNFRFIRAQYDQDKNHHSSFLVMHQWV